MLQRLHQRDLAAYRRLAALRDTPLDRVVPLLTRSADHGLLWIGVAALLSTGRRPQRRAALRGLASLGLASALANVPAKLAVRRARPDLTPVPLVRRLRTQPSTSSFPSGHAASAAAFTVGVALEQPWLALPVGVLAAGVSYGRVHTGVHYPGDVLVGLGVGTLAAALLTRGWPVPPERAAAGARPAPALPEGEGLTVVVNTTSGGGAEEAEKVCRTIETQLPRARVLRTDGDGLTAAFDEALNGCRALGVSGGDGTVGAAAKRAMGAGLPLAVFPGGTLNHFAVDLGVDAVDTVRAVQQGSAVGVSVGVMRDDVTDGIFLNTFALGVYPELVERRERREGTIGKWPAMALATFAVLRHGEPVRVMVDGQPRKLWTLFAGNGVYRPAGFAPAWRPRLDEARLDLRLLDADLPWARTRLVLALLAGRLGSSRAYTRRTVEQVRVTSEAVLTTARDGEAETGPQQLSLHASERLLTVYRPR